MESTAMLDALPSFVSIAPMLKATPKTEGDRRFIYVEASNEHRDQQGEIVLSKALQESATFFRQYGNLDLEHYTQIGARAGIPNYETYEIGLPIDVRIEDGATFVKGEIYAGSGPMAEKRKLLWSSLTEVAPPKRWYPSVGGAVMSKAMSVDPRTKARVAVINAVRWTNLAFSATPVNTKVPTASLVPFGPLAKSWGPAGLDVLKSLTAGYGTDSATLTGGSAVRLQSLDGVVRTYVDFRDALAEAISSGQIAADDREGLVRQASAHFGLSAAQAARYVERFLDDLKRGIKEQA